jgi:hypothetical protein
MRFFFILSVLAASAVAQIQYTSTASAAVAKARATALTLSPTSNVAGKTFNRFVTIWMENTDYAIAAGDRKLYFPLLFDFQPESKSIRHYSLYFSASISRISIQCHICCPNPSAIIDGE